ncbi:MAG TPA: HAD family phosphatase [Ferruginibacter sp.]|jgi:FMN phosphatase YigB (HAD superfamily)|nr:HAD family phosphatase [Ferruginibacter sp.]
MQQIKNIIFDLGGVLLNIDYSKTATAFQQLGFENFDELFSQFKANELFEKLETGDISEELFYQEVQKYAPNKVDQKDIYIAWNAMLLDFRKSSLDFIDAIKDKYRLFLLSNTNIIHLTAFKEIFQKEIGKPSLDGYFIKSYYSHEINLRKPYKNIYAFVLQDGDMKAEETLFIDDSYNNIATAKDMGIQTHLLLPGERIEELGL